MTTLLAKILHPASTATSPDLDGETDIARPRKAGKPRRRRLLAVLAVPPLVTVLSLLSTGVANAADQYWNGPVFPYGPNVVYTQAHADVYCNAFLHQLEVYATANPAIQGETTSEQVYLFVLRNNTWVRYPPGGTVYNQTLHFTTTYPPGTYDIIIRFGWYASDGWHYQDGEVTQYTEWHSGAVDTLPRYCYL
jgi:hypothetical protein